MGKGKKPFAGSVLFPFLNLSRRNPQGEDGTPPPFSKPFPGIYLFALQIDKCHSSFKKVPIQKLIIKIFTDLPVLGTEPKIKPIYPDNCKTTADKSQIQHAVYALEIDLQHIRQA